MNMDEVLKEIHQIALTDENSSHFASLAKDFKNDPLLSPDFDIVNYLNKQFSDEASLDNLP